jgi:hypothetical protein
MLLLNNYLPSAYFICKLNRFEKIQIKKRDMIPNGGIAAPVQAPYMGKLAMTEVLRSAGHVHLFSHIWHVRRAVITNVENEAGSKVLLLGT